MFTDWEFEEDRKDLFQPPPTKKIKSLAVKKISKEGYEASPLANGCNNIAHCTICDKELFTYDEFATGTDLLVQKEAVVKMGKRMHFVCSELCKNMFILTPIEI